MLPYPRENAFLDVDGVSGIGILGEISVNNRLSVIAQKNPEHGFARSFVVGTIKSERRFGKADIALLGPPSQSTDGLNHDSSV